MRATKLSSKMTTIQKYPEIGLNNGRESIQRYALRGAALPKERNPQGLQRMALLGWHSRVAAHMLQGCESLLQRPKKKQKQYLLSIMICFAREMISGNCNHREIEGDLPFLRDGDSVEKGPKTKSSFFFFAFEAILDLKPERNAKRAGEFSPKKP